MTTASAAVTSPHAHLAALREAGLALAARFRHHGRRGEITTIGSSSGHMPAAASSASRIWLRCRVGGAPLSLPMAAIVPRATC